jgi:16S rRNA (uracil1498-N3)-methyltransferase
MPIFFIDKDSEDKEIIIEKGELFHHLNDVIRICNGEELKLFSRNFVYEAVVKEKRPNKILLQIKESFVPKFPLPEISLGQAMIEKSSIESVLQFNVPIFVRDFIFFKAKRSNFIISESVFSRLQRIALSVAEQSEVCFLPGIKISQNFDDCFDTIRNTFIIALHPQGKESFKELTPSIKESNHISVLVGPEGGFTSDELETFRRLDVHIASIKTGIFRSSLAGFVASLLIRELT